MLNGKRRLLVLTHTNPDPDSMASAMGIRLLVREKLRLASDFGLNGRIMRAENREMVRTLGMDMVRMDGLDTSRYDAIAVVDTQPGFGHTQLPAGRTIDVVIDHHVPIDPMPAEAAHAAPPGSPPAAVTNAPSNAASNAAPNAPANATAPAAPATKTLYREVRTEIGATSSMVTGYLMESGITVPPDVATALFYGIKTDTADLSRNASPADEAAYNFLSSRIDRAKLATIAMPDLPLEYYRALGSALNNIRIFGNVVLCSLGKSPNAEMVAEVADLLLRMEGKNAVFCGGVVDHSYHISLRTDHAGRDAYALMRDALGGEGTFGGHGTVAGGTIQLQDVTSRGVKRLERRLEKNILRSMGVEGIGVVGLGG